MGKHRLLSSSMLLALQWMASVMSDPGRSSLQSYLPQETFIIRDVNFNSPMAPGIPLNTPLLQRTLSPQRSSIPGLPYQSVSPQRSFQPSSATQQQSNILQRNPIMTAETPQRQVNLSPQTAYVSATNSNQQRPSQNQPNFTPQRHTVSSNAPQEQSALTQQRPIIPANTLQQHLEFTTQRPNAPSPVLSNGPNGTWRPIAATRQPTRVPQSAGNFQQASSAQQTSHRFSSTIRPIESERPPSPQHIMPQPHQRLVESAYRQPPRPQENTIRKPGNRHHLCGVLPPSGDCRAAFPRYYYNNETDQCDCFLYGGCGVQGLKYSYRTLEECHNTCSPSKREEGPTCKEIYYEDVVYLDPQNHDSTQPFPSAQQNLPMPISTSDPRFHTPVDTSHIPDKPLIILLSNFANQGKRKPQNNHSSSSDRGHQ